MTTEEDRFRSRLLILENGCWEYRKEDGTPYEEHVSPLWGKYESFRHAAVRLIGGFLGTLEKGDRVQRRKSCHKFCVNPTHLTLVHLEKKTRKPTPLSKPPGFEIGKGPSPLYVYDTRVVPKLYEESELPPKKWTAPPGFAGKHTPTFSGDSATVDLSEELE